MPPLPRYEAKFFYVFRFVHTDKVATVATLTSSFAHDLEGTLHAVASHPSLAVEHP